MKSVLISIQPYWLFLIIAKLMGWEIDKNKTIEVRKNFPKAEDWNKLVKIYCSKDKNSFNLIPKSYQPLMQKFLGKVVGEFVCDRINKFHAYELEPSKSFYDIEKARLDLFLKESCLSYNEVFNYRKNLPYFKPLYGWLISDLVIYDKPKELSDFKVVCPPKNQINGDCHLCNYANFSHYGNRPKCNAYLTRPPQSWCYLE